MGVSPETPWSLKNLSLDEISFKSGQMSPLGFVKDQKRPEVGAKIPA